MSTQWNAIVELLAESPLVLLFLVAAIGYPLGRLQVLGTRIGIASVLFAGLALGAIDPRLKLPEIVYQVGLVLFVYPVGLSSGPAFVAAFRRKGLRDNILVAGVLVFATLVALLTGRVIGQDAASTAGLFSGALTNTPALAGVIETLRTTLSSTAFEQIRSRPVIGYSIAYPLGVLGVIGAIAVMQRVWRIDYAQEAAQLKELKVTSDEILTRTIRITRPQLAGRTLQEVAAREGWSAVFTRCKDGDDVTLITPELRLKPELLIIAVANRSELDRIERHLGVASEEVIDQDRREIDYRRIFVSNPQLAGRTIGDLHLNARYGGVVTRVRRGDVDLMAHDDTTLELGDRVRVVARKDQLDAIGRFFGDSYRALSEVDVATFSLGLFAGLLIGLIPIPLGGDVTIKLGIAGGPLIAGLLLGWRGFTGRLVWTLPYSANLTIRQLGLVLFLAGIGTQAGYAFIETLRTPAGLTLLTAGAIITTSAALALLLIGHKLCRIPMSLLTGMIAGLHTQPAVLSYAVEQSGNDLPNVGYATVYPTAIVAKIILAQVLLAIA